MKFMDFTMFGNTRNDSHKLTQRSLPSMLNVKKTLNVANLRINMT